MRTPCHQLPRLRGPALARLASAVGGLGGGRREAEDCQREDKEGQYGQLDLARLDLLAEILGVRPTISPATNTARIAMTSMP